MWKDLHVSFTDFGSAVNWELPSLSLQIESNRHINGKNSSVIITSPTEGWIVTASGEVIMSQVLRLWQQMGLLRSSFKIFNQVKVGWSDDFWTKLDKTNILQKTSSTFPHKILGISIYGHFTQKLTKPGLSRKKLGVYSPYYTVNSRYNQEG